MKKLWLSVLLLAACSEVPAGFVGVKVYKLGARKGVNQEVLPVGRYWIGWNESLYTFPTFEQNYIWTINPKEGKEDDESLAFQTKEGMNIGADIGISYHIDESKVSALFQKYRKGIDEITHLYLRNYVRDALNLEASTMSVEETYGEGKTKLLSNVQKRISGQVGPEGIIVDKIYLVGSFRLPEAVQAALNSKIAATQKAQQTENEVMQAKSQAEKDIAEAKGVAEANRIKQASISDALIRYQAIQKWNGELPQYMSGSLPFLTVPAGAGKVGAR